MPCPAPMSTQQSRRGICNGARGLKTLPLYRTATQRPVAQAARPVVAHAGKVQKITGEQLEVEIEDRDRPLIVDFFATWCGPCVLLAQELEKVAEELGDSVKVVKVDVDENRQLSTQLKIEGLPTMVFIPKDASRPALRTEGLLPAAQIIEIVREMSSPPNPAA
ncbi:thioredoxin-related protein [Haematococcus lacustris]